MLWYIIFGIVVLFIGLMIVSRIFSLAWRIVKIFLLLGLVFCIVFSIIIFNDIKDFKNNFTNSSNIILLEDESHSLYALMETDFSKADEAESMEDIADFYNRTELKEAENYYKKEDFDELLKDNYKIICLNFRILEDFNETEFPIEDISLTGREIIEIIRSENPLDSFAEVYSLKASMPKSDVMAEFENELNSQDIRNYLFGSFVGELFGPTNSVKLIKHITNGDIKFYPRTLMMKTMGLVPDFLIEKIANQNQ
ncbi:hypothetical protein JW949_02680 [Candidatus Woesearchaeota archaeon]|nr:hypothetical protein [Candidatus Woesearchaeota archaeon]